MYIYLSVYLFICLVCACVYMCLSRDMYICLVCIYVYMCLSRDMFICLVYPYVYMFICRYNYLSSLFISICFTIYLAYIYIYFCLNIYIYLFHHLFGKFIYLSVYIFISICFTIYLLNSKSQNDLNDINQSIYPIIPIFHKYPPPGVSPPLAYPLPRFPALAAFRSPSNPSFLPPFLHNPFNNINDRCFCYYY